MALAPPQSRLLEIRLFGEPRFYGQGAYPQSAVPPKAILLLCVLALKHGQPVDRTRLAFTLWPDDPEDEARAKLRRHLHLLQRRFPPTGSPWILASKSDLTWNEEAPALIDVVEFERLTRVTGELERAAALYTGDLLATYYEDWLEAPRKRLRDLQLQNLLALAARAQEASDARSALEYARAALRLDPWHEDAIRSVVLARTQLGDRAGALQEYAQFAQRLRDEFGSEPLPQTLSAVETAKSRAPPKTNVPLETTSYIGRDSETAALRALIERSRLLTLAGPGGVGKSRTAQHLANGLIAGYADGVWHIEAGSQREEAPLLGAIAGALGIREPAAMAQIPALAQCAGNRQALLIFDNAESALEICARICTQLLERCPRLTLLVTSREPLGIPGESVFRLPPLEADADAVALFCDRARAADARFAPAPKDLQHITEIARRVDKLPLAIELAAARSPTLSPLEILEHLHDRFTLLKRARTPAVRHHQTLRATIAWSHDLLSPEERALFASLAIFPAPFTLEAAQSVCAGEIDLLSRLVDKSLLSVREAVPARRYHFLDSVREYALGGLASSTELQTLRERYAAYYDALVRSNAAELNGPRQKGALALLEDELENLRQALEIGLPLRTVCGLQQFCLIRGHYAEGRRWIERALNASSEHATDLRAQALGGAAMLAAFSDDREGARHLETQALQLRTMTGDAGGIAHSLHAFGYYAFDSGEFERAETLFQSALKRAQLAGDEALAAKALDNAGLCAVALGDYERAQDALQASLTMYRTLDDAYGTAWVLGHLAWLAERRREYGESLALHRQSLAIREQLADAHGVACSSLAIARCYEALHDRARAQEARKRSMEIWNELHYTTWLSEAFENYGCAEAACGQAERAATLLGAAQAIRARASRALPIYERAEHEDALTRIADALGNENAQRLMESGSALTIQEAVFFALSPTCAATLRR